MSIGDTVWERSGRSEISRNQFVLLMGFFVLLGLAVTAFVAHFTTGWMELVPSATQGGESSWRWVGPINMWVVVLGVLVCGIVGVFIALGSENPAISLFGYLLVAAPFGLLLGPTVGMYESESVTKVILVTGLVTGVLTLVGAVIPESLEHWAGWLFSALLILLIGQIGIPLLGWLIPGFPLQGALKFWDWIGVLLFSAYVIFDMNRAMRVPATVDNAIDCALALYLDIINLFIRLLEIMGNKKE